MLLSLLGITTTRSRALALFGLDRCNPDYAGADHFDMGKVFAGATQIARWRWEHHREFDFDSISKSLLAHFRRTGCPTLLSFGIIHKNGEWRCGHVAVASGATGKLIELIDPLASKPRTYSGSNVWLQRAGKPHTVNVIGNSYCVDSDAEAAILRWRVSDTL